MEGGTTAANSTLFPFPHAFFKTLGALGLGAALVVTQLADPTTAKRLIMFALCENSKDIPGGAGRSGGPLSLTGSGRQIGLFVLSSGGVGHQ